MTPRPDKINEIESKRDFIVKIKDEIRRNV